MNVVLIQELHRYNVLITTVKLSLVELKKSLNGEIVITKELEDFNDSLINNIVPVL